MIDIHTEDLLTSGEARQSFPKVNGKHPDKGYVYRAMKRGFLDGKGNRVRLESARVSGLLVTSKQAIRRFLDALNGRAEAAAGPPPTSSAQAAHEELAAVLS